MRCPHSSDQRDQRATQFGDNAFVLVVLGRAGWLLDRGSAAGVVWRPLGLKAPPASAGATCTHINRAYEDIDTDAIGRGVLVF